MTLFISKIIKQDNAISHSDGLTLYDYISSNLKGSEFVLSFKDINRVSTAFLNASVGKLYMDGMFNETFVDKKNTDEMIIKKIESVLFNARNHDIYNQAVNDAKHLC
jgi:hypothetical protein